MLTNMKHYKASKNKWYIAIRGSYLPVSWQGWLLHLAFVLYAVTSAVVIVQHNSSIPFIAIQILAQLVAATVILTWVAQRKS